jgi:hypothetical protein
MAEIGWREFAHHLLHHFPRTTNEPLRADFVALSPGARMSASLPAWQRGRTGIPLVDAGMRELWETGWMHNRVRMVVASFLVKNLRMHWLHGARWFWDTLGRRRSRQQHARLAVGRRLRRRCRTLLPGLQSAEPGREVRCAGRIPAALAAGTAPEPWRRGLSAADRRSEGIARSRARRLQDFAGNLNADITAEVDHGQAHRHVAAARGQCRKPADAARIKALLEALNGRIPGLLRIEVGVNFIEDAQCSRRRPLQRVHRPCGARGLSGASAASRGGPAGASALTVDRRSADYFA